MVSVWGNIWQTTLYLGVKHLPYKTNPFLADWSFDHIRLISKKTKIYLPKSSPNLMMVIQWFLTVMFPISGQIMIIHQPETCGHFGMIPLINHDWGREKKCPESYGSMMVSPTISSAPGRTLVQLLHFRPRAAGVRASVDLKRVREIPMRIRIYENWDTYESPGMMTWPKKNRGIMMGL